MATKIESEFSSTNDESDGEQEILDNSEAAVDPEDKKESDEDKQESDEDKQEPEEDKQESEEDEPEPEDEQEPEEEPAPVTTNNNVQDILKRLQSSGALIKKPKQEFYCFKCKEDFPDWEELENHLVQHVSLPSVVVDKLPSDDEDFAPSGDENWSEEEDEVPPPTPTTNKTPTKVDISQILKKTGLSIKKPGEINPPTASNESALNKLSGLGFTIKKGSTPIKQEKPDSDQKQTDVMKKLGNLGGIKLKLKSDGGNTNSFKVVNGLKDFKASDDEEDSANENNDKDDDEEEDKDKSDPAESEEEESLNDIKNGIKKSTDEVEKVTQKNKNLTVSKAIQGKLITPKKEPTDKPTPVRIPVKRTSPVKEPENTSVRRGRPPIKQTPKRGANLPVSKNGKETKEAPTQGKEVSTTSTPERRESNDSSASNSTVVKQEVEHEDSSQVSDVPLFSGKVKTERESPPPAEAVRTQTPIIASVKTESDPAPPSTQALFSNQTKATTPTTTNAPITTPLLPVTKTEVAVIEINGDSGDDDDDCCVVSATPAPDVKPKIEVVSTPYPPPAPPPPYSSATSQTNYGTTSQSNYSSSNTFSTEKQHSFNWNAPDSKPPIDILEKSADEIFESLLSTTPKKENMILSDASEYISLDTLGPQHSCDVCNTRFTNISLLEDHIRTTGHSKSIITPTSQLMPYSPSSSGSILQSLLPVKHLAEQVGKLSTITGAGAGFTHQQNVMINIQAYPGAGGVMVPPQYNSYPGQNMHSGGYPQAPQNSMYGPQGQPMPGQTMPGQYSSANYAGATGYGQQFQTPISSAGYGPNAFVTPVSSPYSSASPLQSMQQAVYGQADFNSQPGQMGPPAPPGQYISASSPSGSMKPPAAPGTASGVKIHNVQTFPPGQPIARGTIGQIPGQGAAIQGQVPGQIKVAPGANVSGPRHRMPIVRGARPSIRPGVQVHGQVRGAKPGGPRMPMKRPGGAAGGPNLKRRPDMLLPDKHDNEDCTVMAMQKQRDGYPMISSVQGAKDKLNLGSQISVTKKPVNKEANAMANVLASRGISIKQKQKSRSPSPERPVPHIPNLGAGMSIKHTSKSSNFSIPEAKVGGGMLSCKVCKKMFSTQSSLMAHMSAIHPQMKAGFKCDDCPASYRNSLQLQHHKRVFHNVTGPNRELGLPVVDLSQEDNLQRLSNLGIYSYIPLANREQADGTFGIPILSVTNMMNGMASSLRSLGADGLLSLGPLKTLPNT